MEWAELTNIDSHSPVNHIKLASKSTGRPADLTGADKAPEGAFAAVLKSANPPPAAPTVTDGKANAAQKQVFGAVTTDASAEQATALSTELTHLNSYLSEASTDEASLMLQLAHATGEDLLAETVTDVVGTLIGDTIAAFDIAQGTDFAASLESALGTISEAAGALTLEDPIGGQVSLPDATMGLQIVSETKVLTQDSVRSINQETTQSATDASQLATNTSQVATDASHAPAEFVLSGGVVTNGSVISATSRPTTLFERLKAISTPVNAKAETQHTASIKELVSGAIQEVAAATGVSKPMLNTSATATGTLLFQASAVSGQPQDIATSTADQIGESLNLLSNKPQNVLIAEVLAKASAQANLVKDGFAEIMKTPVQALPQGFSDDLSSLGSASSLIEQGIGQTSGPARFEAALMASVHNRDNGVTQNDQKMTGFSSLVANQIKSIEVKPGERTKIELAPKGLGGIEIQFDADFAGKTRAIIRIENQTVLEAMRNDRAALEEMLSKAGIDLSGGLDLAGYEGRGSAGGDNNEFGEIQPDDFGDELDKLAPGEVVHQVITEEALNITV
jgi:hypothetical protein